MCDQIVKWIRGKGTVGRSVLSCVKEGRITCLPGLAVGILAVCLLCGCTRREQLVLDTDQGKQSAGGITGSSQAGLSDGDAAGGSVPEEQSQNTADDGGQDISVRSGAGALEQAAAAGQQIQTEEALTICVHVCGAVKDPGVYELAAGSRVFEAVREAGGFTAEADESYVNQAQRLTDGAKLVIPTVEQAKDASGSGEGSAAAIGIVRGDGEEQADSYGVSAGNSSTDGVGAAADGRININTASEAQLCEIPGIGAVRAAAIAAYREQSGGFHSIEDIMKVNGIKEGTYEKIKDKIKVN